MFSLVICNVLYVYLLCSLCVFVMFSFLSVLFSLYICNVLFVFLYCSLCVFVMLSLCICNDLFVYL